MAYGYNIDQRKINKRNHIVDLFRRHQVLSKARAKELSGYSMDTVISIFNNLSDETIIMPAEGEQKAKGRKAEFYCLQDHKCCYLGIAFNQSGIYSSLVSFSGKLLDATSTPLDPGISKEDFLERFTGHIRSCLERQQSAAAGIRTVGCSVPGDVDLKSGVLRSYAFMPSLQQVNLREAIESVVPGVQVILDHNIRSMTAYVLKEIEPDRKFDRVLFVSARAGATHGFIYKSDIVTDHGQMGHIRVSNEPVLCSCGRTGCLDAFFSYRSFLTSLARYEGRDPQSALRDMDGGRAELQKLAALYRDNVTPVREDLNTRLSYFISALMDLVNATRPDLVVLSGELLSVYGDPLEAINEVIRREYQDHDALHRFRNAQIVYRDFGTEIASTGVCHEIIRREWGYMAETA